MVLKNKPVNEVGGFDNQMIGARLSLERKRLGLSQADVRAKTGVGKNAQINYEAGTTYPDASYLALLHEAGFDLMFILTGERSPSAPMKAEHQNLHDAYEAAPEALRRAVFAVLLSPYNDEWDKSRVVPGYFRVEIIGEDGDRHE